MNKSIFPASWQLNAVSAMATRWNQIGRISWKSRLKVSSWKSAEKNNSHLSLRRKDTVVYPPTPTYTHTIIIIIIPPLLSNPRMLESLPTSSCSFHTHLHQIIFVLIESLKTINYCRLFSPIHLSLRPPPSRSIPLSLIPLRRRRYRR